MAAAAAATPGLGPLQLQVRRRHQHLTLGTKTADQSLYCCSLRHLLTMVLFLHLGLATGNLLTLPLEWSHKKQSSWSDLKNHTRSGKCNPNPPWLCPAIGNTRPKYSDWLSRFDLWVVLKWFQSLLTAQIHVIYVHPYSQHLWHKTNKNVAECGGSQVSFKPLEHDFFHVLTWIEPSGRTEKWSALRAVSFIYMAETHKRIELYILVQTHNNFDFKVLKSFVSWGVLFKVKFKWLSSVK